MFRFLFLLFVVMPIIEIAILMQVGALLGAWPTVAIVVITAWIGAKKVKQQGIATLTSVQHKLAEGQMPSDEIVAGLMLLVSGVLLVTPGFVTDAFGLALLVPAFRASLAKAVAEQMAKSPNVQVRQFHFRQPDTDNHHAQPSQERFRSGNTLDGEFERKD